MSPRLAFALNAVWSAGRSTLSLFQNLEGFDSKEDQTPVTAADRRAEEIIRAEIEKAFPGETVLGEEQGLTGASDSRWVVDPIDGTKSFVAGVPLYATLLAWEQEGEPEIGVVYFPALDEMFYAEKGGAALRNGRPIRVSSRPTVTQSILCHAGAKGMAAGGHAKGLETLARRAMATRTWCDAYGHMLVAAGRADAMFDPVVSRWDVSALLPILACAGGMATRLDGGSVLEPMRPDGALQMLSSNGLLHEEVRRELTP
jgi:histidinol-phosphatase